MKKDRWTDKVSIWVTWENLHSVGFNIIYTGICFVVGRKLTNRSRERGGERKKEEGRGRRKGSTLLSLVDEDGRTDRERFFMGHGENLPSVDVEYILVYHRCRWKTDRSVRRKRGRGRRRRRRGSWERKKKEGSLSHSCGWRRTSIRRDGRTKFLYKPQEKTFLRSVLNIIIYLI